MHHLNAASIPFRIIGYIRLSYMLNSKILKMTILYFVRIQNMDDQDRTDLLEITLGGGAGGTANGPSQLNPGQ